MQSNPDFISRHAQRAATVPHLSACVLLSDISCPHPLHAHALFPVIFTVDVKMLPFFFSIYLLFCGDRAARCYINWILQQQRWTLLGGPNMFIISLDVC